MYFFNWSWDSYKWRILLMECHVDGSDFDNWLQVFFVLFCFLRMLPCAKVKRVSLLNSAFNVAAFTTDINHFISCRLHRKQKWAVKSMMVALNHEVLLASCQFLMACGGKELEEKKATRSFVLFLCRTWGRIRWRRKCVTASLNEPKDYNFRIYESSLDVVHLCLYMCTDFKNDCVLKKELLASRWCDVA